MAAQVKALGQAKAGDGVARQAAKVDRAQVGTAEGDARYVLENRGVRPVHVAAPEFAPGISRFDFVDVRRVAIGQHNMLRTVGQHTYQLIADHAGNPGATLRIEREAVGERAALEGGHDFLRTQRGVRPQRVARHLLVIGLVDVQPKAVGRDQRLVGETDAIGDDARAALVQQDDKAIGDRGVVGQGARPVSGRNRDPDSSLVVLGDEIGRRQVDAVDPRQYLADGARAR